MCCHTRRNQISSFALNGGIHLNRRGRQFSRLLAAEVCASAVVMLDTPCSEVVWRVLATHCIRQFPLHFPSVASPCAITFQMEIYHLEHYGITGVTLEGRPSADVTSIYMKTQNRGRDYRHWRNWGTGEIVSTCIDFTPRISSPAKPVTYPSIPRVIPG